MSYLIFLLFIVDSNFKDDFIKNSLIKLLSHITKENVEYAPYRLASNIDGDFFDKILLSLDIGDKRFNEQDFEIIREIILLQNGLSTKYIEEFNPDLEDRLNKSQGNIDATTFEEEVVVLASLLKKTIDK